MQVVGLHEGAVFGDAGEKIRDQRHLLGGGDLPEHGLKAVGVSRTVIGRQTQARDQYLAASGAGQPNDGGQVVPQDPEAKAAQTIVGPQFQQDQAGAMFLQEPRQTGATAGGGLAGDAGVDDAIRQCPFAQPFLQQLYPAVVMVNPIGGA